MRKYKNIYEKLFLENRNGSKEYGNVSASFDYFKRFKINKNLKILDVGTNIGSLINRLNEKGWTKVQGIDINIYSIKFGKKKYKQISNKLLHYDGKKIPFPENTFNVVMMFDVIEHVPNPKSFLEEVRRILKKDGKLIFQTPNKPINILWAYISNHSFRVKWWEEHCSLQTYFSLKKLLCSAGFSDVLIEKHNIFTDYNKNKVKKKMGVVGIFSLYLMSKLPIIIYPNFYGVCKK